MAIENWHREEKLEGSSDRSFGFVFSVFFCLVGCWPILHGGSARVWSLVASGTFLVLAIARPTLLTGLNRLWMRVGLLLSRIVSPVALGIVFFLAVFPTALIMRLLRKDSLRLKFNPEATTYWIVREPPGPDPKTMNNQF